MNDKTVENAIEPEKPRSIDAIYKLDPSELSSEELELLIDYKAEQQAKDIHFKEQQRIMNDAMQQLIDDSEERYRKTEDLLHMLTANALERLERASNG